MRYEASDPKAGQVQRHYFLLPISSMMFLHLRDLQHWRS